VSLLAAGQRLHDEDFVIGCDRVAQPLAIAHRLVANEDVDPSSPHRAQSGSYPARSVGEVWIGRGLTGLVVLFMLFDGVTKIAGEEHVVKAMNELGWPAGQTVGLGILVLACTAVYAIPRTSILGAYPEVLLL
jgi:hypothetical protein